MKAPLFSSALVGAVLATLVYGDCPAAGTTDGQGRYSCNPAHQYPSGQTCKPVDGCYYLSKDGADGPSHPACPAPGSRDDKGRYSCNPAHMYPGQICKVTDGCYFLSQNATSIRTSAQPSATVACPAAGTTDQKGRYSCNPAHQYPNGQTCVNIEGCYYLCQGGTPITNTPSQTAIKTSAEPSATSACPAPGTTDSKGRYSCNPAHQYPNGQTCMIIEGCYYLCQGGAPITNTPLQTSIKTSAEPSATSACPAPGTTDGKGRYSCNPAHQYPNGQTCVIIEGCYFLCQGGVPITNTPSPSQTSIKTSAEPSATSACPAPGTTDSKGRYSCNPAHQYPNGQTCTNVEGCYYLCQNGLPITTTAVQTGSKASAQPSATACPAPGTTDGQGRYSCNPAHAYPNGQACVAMNGCYYLCSNGTPVTTAPAKTSATAACPTPGSTDDKGRYSCNPAHRYPDGQACVAIGGCFYLCQNGTPVTRTSAPSSTPSCPAPGSYDSKGRYSCNPAHRYPDGQSCVATDGCYYLCANCTRATNTTAPPTSTPTACPAPGSLDSKGRYSCNPAHHYPNGQSCIVIDGCYYLCNNGVPVTTATTQPTATPAACPVPGTLDSKGRYSCNPAHQYPNGQTCAVIDGCYYLCKNGEAVTSKAAQPTSTPGSCPAPGTTDGKGRYSCNPAHQYPNGQTCVVIDGCYYLCQNGTPVKPSSIQTSAVQPTATPGSCPAPGTIDNQGRYSCNPAHQYPEGQSCIPINGCYYLCQNGTPVKTSSVQTKPAQTSAVQPTSTPGSCPAPGTTDSKGRYSCNPAHQYPSGQTCVVVDGCYYLTEKPASGSASRQTVPAIVTSAVPTNPAVVPGGEPSRPAIVTSAVPTRPAVVPSGEPSRPAIVTAGASSLRAAGALACVVAGAVALF
ncbi:hypothetical protein AAL_02948 [Moelleriella libera RCEF 2490]|uniref:Uncharacterized protein n=1 Tax=Moelleriella libera RCEF 2490 TaxID=1081109 RepID=A0A166PQQ6_9HYPO|nr:hypothetical protein AAL_02948 [Moelleriella libera RCEF 2490]